VAGLLGGASCRQAGIVSPPSPLPPGGPTLPAPSILRDGVTISTNSSGIWPRDAATVAGSYDIPVDWGIYAAYPYVAANVQEVRNRVASQHASGRLYAQYISAGLMYQGGGNTGDLRPDLLDAAALDVDGRPITRRWQSSTVYAMDVNEPAWQAFLESEMLAAVDAGADAIVLDDIQAQVLAVGFERAGVFNQADMRGFREFLRGVYSADVLASRFGIADVNAFDYGQHIRALGLTATWRTAPWEVALYNQFVSYEYRSTIEVYRRLVQAVKQRGRAVHGKEVMVLGNTSTGGDMSLPFEDPLDLAWVEFPYLDWGYPPRCKVMPSARLLLGGRWKKGTYLTQVPTNADLARRGQPATISKIFLAEAYASHAEYQVPYEVVGGAGNYSPDLRELAPYYRFVARERALFGPSWTWTPQVAIFYPLTSYLGGGEGYYGASLALTEGGVSFDAVVSGDGRILENRVTLATLRTYPVVVLAGASSMSAEQVQLVLDYVEGGGVVVAWGGLGQTDEFHDASAARPSAWTTMQAPGTYTVGSGVLRNVTATDLGREYFVSRDDGARDAMLQAIGDVVTPDVRVDTRDVVAVAYRHATESRLVVHLVNYAYDLATDRVTPAQGVRVTLRLPPGFSMDGKQARLRAPDHPDPDAVSTELRGQEVVFTVPRLDVYGLLVVEPAASATRERVASRVSR
jgi:hypothetical protein